MDRTPVADSLLAVVEVLVEDAGPMGAVPGEMLVGTTGCCVLLSHTAFGGLHTWGLDARVAWRFAGSLRNLEEQAAAGAVPRRWSGRTRELGTWWSKARTPARVDSRKIRPRVPGRTSAHAARRIACSARDHP